MANKDTIIDAQMVFDDTDYGYVDFLFDLFPPCKHPEITDYSICIECGKTV